MCCIAKTLQITVFSPTEPRSVDLFDEQALWVTAAKGLASILTRATAKAVRCDTYSTYLVSAAQHCSPSPMMLVDQQRSGILSKEGYV